MSSKRIIIISLIFGLLYGSIFGFETKVINTTDIEVWLTVIQGDSSQELHVAPQSEKTFSYEIIDPNNIKYNLSWGSSDNTWWGYAEAPITEANTWQPGYASKQYDLSSFLLTKKEKSAVSTMIRTTYIGFTEMKEKGFKLKMIDECETIGDLFAFLINIFLIIIFLLQLTGVKRGVLCGCSKLLLQMKNLKEV